MTLPRTGGSFPSESDAWPACALGEAPLVRRARRSVCSGLRARRVHALLSEQPRMACEYNVSLYLGLENEEQGRFYGDTLKT